MIIVTYRKVFYMIAGIAVLASLVSVAVFGLNFGVDFTGGTLVEVRYEDGRPASAAIAQTLFTAGIEGASIRESGGDAYLIRAGELTDGERDVLPQLLTQNGAYTPSIERFTEIGPTIGRELRNKAFVAIALVAVAIILYIAFAFRKVFASTSRKQRGVSSWAYGVIAVVALLHDMIIPIGMFSVLGFVFGAQIDTLFVMALLAILGYSVNDTIVVFDRVRENLHDNSERGKSEEFELTVGKSLNQTFVRSINTSLTTLLVLITLFFMGPVATQDFALVLIVGVIAGTYSSLALATPLLVTAQEWRKRGK